MINHIAHLIGHSAEHSLILILGLILIAVLIWGTIFSLSLAWASTIGTYQHPPLLQPLQDESAEQLKSRSRREALSGIIIRAEPKTKPYDFFSFSLPMKFCIALFLLSLTSPFWVPLANALKELPAPPAIEAPAQPLSHSVDPEHAA